MTKGKETYHRLSYFDSGCYRVFVQPDKAKNLRCRAELLNEERNIAKLKKTVAQDLDSLTFRYQTNAHVLRLEKDSNGMIRYSLTHA